MNWSAPALQIAGGCHLDDFGALGNLLSCGRLYAGCRADDELDATAAHKGGYTRYRAVDVRSRVAFNDLHRVLYAVYLYAALRIHLCDCEADAVEKWLAERNVGAAERRQDAELDRHPRGCGHNRMLEDIANHLDLDLVLAALLEALDYGY